MKKINIIKKFLVFGAWFLVISGITTLLIAANRRKNDHSCTKILVGIGGTGAHYYLKEEDILKLLEKTDQGTLLMKPVADINLQNLEKVLKSNAWIKSAELYFDSNDALHVFVRERSPIARIFTTSGSSFYIDSSGHRMPLLKTGSIRLPVITGFIQIRKMNQSDSIQLNAVKKLAWFLVSNEFWNAQIGQVDIMPDKKFELIPVIGDHIIKIGNAENIDAKFNRLFVFYKQVMARTGFSKYATLDVQFDKQIVAIHKNTVSAVDSIQLQKNIETLMNRSSLQQVDAEMLPEPVMQPAVAGTGPGNDSVQKYIQRSRQLNPAPALDRYKPTKTNPSKPELKTNETKIPKAVMKKNE